MKIVVLDGYTENPGDLSWDGLGRLGELTVYDRTSLTDEDEAISRIGDAEVVFTNKTPITKKVIDACPGVKFISLLSTGYNVVDYAYAAEKGITIVMENHGFFINGSERILRLIEAIDRPNLKMTVDVGNFLCVDEDPVAAVKRCLPMAEMIHLKDFYIRKKEQLPDQTEMFNCNKGSWFETMGGKMIRGSILGQGDMDIWEILKTIKHSDFDGYISLEFEGMEPCEQGTEIGLAMARAILDKV